MANKSINADKRVCSIQDHFLISGCIAWSAHLVLLRPHFPKQEMIPTALLPGEAGRSKGETKPCALQKLPVCHPGPTLHLAQSKPCRILSSTASFAVHSSSPWRFLGWSLHMHYRPLNAIYAIYCFDDSSNYKPNPSNFRKAVAGQQTHGSGTNAAAITKPPRQRATPQKWPYWTADRILAKGESAPRNSNSTPVNKWKGHSFTEIPGKNGKQVSLCLPVYRSVDLLCNICAF